MKQQQQKHVNEALGLQRPSSVDNLLLDVILIMLFNDVLRAGWQTRIHMLLQLRVQGIYMIHAAPEQLQSSAPCWVQGGTLLLCL